MNGSAASLALSTHLAALSLISFGGIPVILPEIRELVVANEWTTDREFADFFALSQVMPGPNFIFMLSLIGWKVGGPLGAVAATLGIAGPSCTLTFIGFRLWHRFRDAPWRLIIARGIVPLTIGLIIAGGWVLAHAAGNGWRGLAIAAVAAGLLLKTRVSPLWLLGMGGAVGGLGLL